VWGHPQTSGEKLLKDHRFIGIGLWNSLLPGLTAQAFGKIATVNHSTNLADNHSWRPKEKAPRAGTIIHDITILAVWSHMTLTWAITIIQREDRAYSGGKHTRKRIYIENRKWESEGTKKAKTTVKSKKRSHTENGKWESEIDVGRHGGGAPKLIWGCERSLKRLRFKLEIKSEFNWKNKIP
jgi:hypothetical protein